MCARRPTAGGTRRDAPRARCARRGLELDVRPPPRWPVTVAYERYGRLNRGARQRDPRLPRALRRRARRRLARAGAAKPGWWDVLIGPGKAFDTDRYFVVSSNVLGSCYGTTGPASIDPATGRPYGSRFPVVTISDMVRGPARARRQPRHQPAARRRGRIDGRHAGAAVGGRSTRTPSSRSSPSPRPSRHSPQQIAFNEIARRAVMSDPNWQRRRLLRRASARGGPRRRAHARPRHVSVRQAGWSGSSAAACRTDGVQYGFGREFEVESYLEHQGQAFVDRFDANSLLYLTRAIDYFDLDSSRRHARRRLQRQRRGVPVPHVLVRLALSAVPPRRGGGRGTGRGPARQLPGDSQRVRPRRLPARARGAGTRHSRVSCRGRSV